MSFTEVSQVLQMQGGTPQLKSGSVFSENLPVTKNITAPTPGNMIPGLTTTGLSSILQNPLQAIMTQATSTISQLASSLGGSALPATTSALSAVSQALSELNSSAESLSGVQAPVAGDYGEHDLALHYVSAHLLGDSPPAALSPSVASGPLTSASLVESVVAAASSAVQSALSGATSDAEASATLSALSASLTAVVDDSDAAIAGLRAAVPALAAAARVGGVAAAAVVSRSSFVPGYSDPNVEALDALYQTTVQPAAYAALKAAALAACNVPPPVLGPVAPILPADNVAVRLSLSPSSPSGDASVEVI